MVDYIETVIEPQMDGINRSYLDGTYDGSEKNSQIISINSKYSKLVKTLADRAEYLSLAKDPDIGLEAKAAADRLFAEALNLRDPLRDELLKHNDPYFSQNEFLIRIHASGGKKDDQINLQQLLSRYQKLARAKGIDHETIQEVVDSKTKLLKDVFIIVRGRETYKTFIFEAGAQTFTISGGDKGQVFTNKLAVTVTPPDPQNNTSIHDDEINVVAFAAASGPGGQHVNRTATAIRATHRPTGISVAISNHRSQQANRKAALAILGAKVSTHYNAIASSENRAKKKDQVGKGQAYELPRHRSYRPERGFVSDNRVPNNGNNEHKVSIGPNQSIEDIDLSSFEDALLDHRLLEIIRSRVNR